MKKTKELSVSRAVTLIFGELVVSCAFNVTNLNKTSENYFKP